MGTLFLVATPIGNLEDISARALRLLAQVSLIAAEDTRHTRKLLDHFLIRTPMTSYHEHNKLAKVGEILAALGKGDVALVSDAGTPGLNDPGYELIKAAIAAGYPVSPVPGPSAPLSALVASGLPMDAFIYLGYLPRKSADRRRLLAEVAELRYTLILLESPQRLLTALGDMLEVLGDRPVAVARELTKLYEEIYRGRISQAQEYFSARPARGEFTLVVAGKQPDDKPWTEAQLRDEIQKYLRNAAPASQIAAELASRSNWPRRTIYRLVMEMSKEEFDEPG
jgi:16S rRNA (cytidine1402-2'-O)-methyltransferase